VTLGPGESRRTVTTRGIDFGGPRGAAFPSRRDLLRRGSRRNEPCVHLSQVPPARRASCGGARHTGLGGRHRRGRDDPRRRPGSSRRLAAGTRLRDAMSRRPPPARQQRVPAGHGRRSARGPLGHGLGADGAGHRGPPGRATLRAGLRRAINWRPGQWRSAACAGSGSSGRRWALAVVHRCRRHGLGGPGGPAPAGGWTSTWAGGLALSAVERRDRDRRPAPMSAQLRLWAQKWRHYERNSLPWKPGPHPLGVHAARGLRALAGPRQRAPGAARGAAGGRGLGTLFRAQSGSRAQAPAARADRPRARSSTSA